MPRQDRHYGFTLIELMVAIAVLAVLLTIAVPSFTGMIRSNQVANQTNVLIGSLNAARSEASKRGMPTTVCAAAKDLKSCSGKAEDWQTNGWLVITDAGGDAGQLDTASGDLLLQASNAPAGQMQLKTTYTFVRFNADGSRTNESAQLEMVFDVRHTVCKDNEQRRVQVNRNGRITMSKSACT